METLYWICEYGKVFCGYMFFMFVWPSVVFSKHLRGKDKIYHFSFCVLVQVILANTVVLTLGLLHILNRWIVVGIFYGIFIINIVRKLMFLYHLGQFSEMLASAYRLLMGTCGIRLFLYQRVKKIKGWFKGIFVKIWYLIRLHLMEYSLLLVVVIYGMIYFSYGVFQDYNYGFGDMYVHHQWINGLLEGTIFYNGVYPEAMHCFIYCLHVLFGLKIYDCILFLAGIHVSVFMISIYCFLKEIFHWKYTPIFVLIIFLTLDLMCIQEVYGMSRLQWTIPQEFGLYTQFLCTLYLIRYLKSSYTRILKNRFKKFIWNENLLLFMMSLAASLAIHFYSTIMAFLLCVSFAVFALPKILKMERFFPLVVAVICGVLIGITPMVGALASGIPFQGSIGWAVGVMEGDELQDEEPEENKAVQKNTSQNDNRTFIEKLKGKISILYWQGYATLYQKERAYWIVGLTGLAVILWIIYQVIRMICNFITKKSFREKYFNGYMPIVMASILFMIVYASPALGIPQLLADSRICTTEQLLILSIIAMPTDMVFTLLSFFLIDCVLQIFSIMAAAGICISTVMNGNYHGYLYCELSRYNEAIKVTDSIINKFPEFSYTIVSTTDELYHVNQYGRHEELLTFLQEIDKDDYKLPTEYVFVYVEKKPLEYGQSHYFRGPEWLAGEKYTDLYVDFESRCPEINASEISEKEAQKDILFYARPSLSYTILESRTILESKAYLWCQNFAKLHPFEVNTYYEDENFVCYYFKQNPYALYDLAIEGWDRTDGIEW